MTQTSYVVGSGNVVVQIVGEGNAVTIAGAAGLRLVRYEGAAFADPPQRVDRAGEPGWTASGRREIRILSPFNRTSLPFQGRQALTATLQDWLTAPSPMSVHALVGGGGRGKTRLAVELAAWACEQGWTAGFARREQVPSVAEDLLHFWRRVDPLFMFLR